MMDLLDEKPKGKLDYDHWISDGIILSRGSQFIYQQGHLNLKNKKVGIVWPSVSNLTH